MRIEVSATGKVLIAGGYIVLEKEFKGIVLPLTAKFHATIENKTNFEYNSTENNNEKLIFIETPQIEFKKYIYSYKRNSVSTELILIKNDRTEKNKFIDSALNFSFKLLNELIRQQKILNFDEMLNHIKITLFGDQEFYTKTVIY
ncbi:phosphomevalonate kinase [Bonamia ostreae]|uniref:phosphomevalonate kinase n=1 Tax=Bonamia ostreae TaxID=126728 RepID=A0ABV2AQ22_9EUKA